LKDNLNKLTSISTVLFLAVFFLLVFNSFIIKFATSNNKKSPDNNKEPSSKITSTLSAQLRKLFPVSCIIIFLILTLNGYVFLDQKMNVPTGPNIIIVVADALRRDHLGCYGYDRNTSPNIDLFAQDATLFKNFFAQSPSTKPSVASIFTSKHPDQHNVIYNEDVLPLLQTTLAEILQDNNFSTAAFIENKMIGRKLGFTQGFDLWHFFKEPRGGIDKHDSLKEFDRKIYSWLDRHHRKPFFLYIHYLDPHAIYKAPEPFYKQFVKNINGDMNTNENVLDILNEFFHDKPEELKIATDLYKGKLTYFRSRFMTQMTSFFTKYPDTLKHIVALYDGEIKYIDSKFERLIKKIEKLNIKDETIIIFLSDHGEGFLEHGHFFHSYSVFAEVINVPLIIRYPRLFKKGIEEKHVQHIDILPTILSALNLDYDKIPLYGNNIAEKSNIKETKIIYSQLRKKKADRQRCIITENWKLIHDVKSDEYYLFNLRDDPSDSSNVAPQNQEISEQLASYLSEWLKNLTDIRKPGKTIINKKMRKTLKSLGYI